MATKLTLTRLELCQDAPVTGDLQVSKSTSDSILCILFDRTRVPISDIISLDAGCRSKKFLIGKRRPYTKKLLHRHIQNLMPSLGVKELSTISVPLAVWFVITQGDLKLLICVRKKGGLGIASENYSTTKS